MDNTNNASNSKKIKSPKKLVAVVRTKTFIVENELSVSECEGQSSPLEFYSHFSRFPIIIINEDKKALKANIRVNEIADIIKRTNFIYNKNLEMELMGTPKASESQSSPAYTVKITSGELKGKTPAQILFEDPNNTDKLNNLYKWLKGNLSKNPKYKESNQRQMNAILDASKLMKEGKLEKPEVNAMDKFPIFESGFRPLTRKTKPDGSCFVYETSIHWVSGSKYPVEVEIKNYYAPVTQDSKGLLNVQVKKRTDFVASTMGLTIPEWMNVIAQIEANMRTFENVYACDLYKLAFNAAKENRLQAKAEKESQGNQETNPQEGGKK